MKRVSHHFKLAETPFIADRILHNYKRDRSLFEQYSPIFNNEFLVNFEEKVDKMVHFFPLQSLETEFAESNEKGLFIVGYITHLLGITEALINCVPYGSALRKTKFNFNKLREALKQESVVEIQKAGLSENDIRISEKLIEKKFRTHRIKTDKGIEINIPLEYTDKLDMIEFINNPDGTISIMIKNVGKIVNR